MIRRPPRSTRTDTLFPYPTLFRSIQAAEAADIKVEQSEIDQYFAQYAQNFGSTPEAFAELLHSKGSSARVVKRQIHGEMAWTRLQRSRIEPFVNVGEEEVQSIRSEERRVGKECVSWGRYRR